MGLKLYNIISLQAADLKAPVDSRVVDHINSLVDEGVNSAPEMKRHVRIFVRNLFARAILAGEKGACLFFVSSCYRVFCGCLGVFVLVSGKHWSVTFLLLTDIDNWRVFRLIERKKITFHLSLFVRHQWVG